MTVDGHSKSRNKSDVKKSTDNTEWTAEKMHAGCKAGEAKAWEAAYNYILAFLRNSQTPVNDLKDIAHQTFEYFLAGGVDKVKEGRAYKMWLRLKARSNRTDMCYRGARILEDPIEMPDREGDGFHENPNLSKQAYNPDMPLFVKDVLKVIRTELKAIGERCEKFLKRYYQAKFLGEKQADVARELGESHANFRGVVHRCKQNLLERSAYKEIFEQYIEIMKENEALE